MFVLIFIHFKLSISCIHFYINSYIVFPLSLQSFILNFILDIADLIYREASLFIQ